MSEQIGVSESTGLSDKLGGSECTIRMNQRLGKVVCGGWVGGWVSGGCIWIIASALVPFEI